MNYRAAAVYVALSLLGLVAGIVLCEVALRTYHAFKSGTAEPLRLIERDGHLGWRPTANYQVRYRVRSMDGAEQTVSYSSVVDGFRIFGDVNATRRKLLIIGDSSTQATNIPTDKTYAALLSMALDVEVFSYGGGGFGTLQELMVLEDVIDKINPDVVVLQFCSNDFINNSFELESRSWLNNNRMIRPYLGVSGAISYKNPFSGNAVLSALLEKSRLFNFLANRLLSPSKGSVEGIVARNPSDSDFRESIRVTRELLERFRNKVGAVRKLYVFTSDGAHTRIRTIPEEYQGYSGIAEKALLEILMQLHVTFLAGVADAVAEMESKGVVVKDSDGAHWNEAGHRVVASVLAERLRSQLGGTPNKGQ